MMQKKSMISSFVFPIMVLIEVSVSYALVAYQMAYLKANYYVYFMQALLNSVIEVKKPLITTTKIYIRMAFQLLPPNIKLSHDQFEVISMERNTCPFIDREVYRHENSQSNAK